MNPTEHLASDLQMGRKSGDQLTARQETTQFENRAFRLIATIS